MKIIQVLDALDYGDGVCNDVIHKDALLKKLGYTSEIYSKWVHDKVRNCWRDIETLQVDKEDIIIHHYSGVPHIMEYIKDKKCKKVLMYHNVTPSKFSVGGNDAERAMEILKENFSIYDYFAAVSQFNADDLKRIGLKEECDILPILLDFGKDNNEKIKVNTTNFLFVGRIAPNKKDEDVVGIFNYYYQYIDANSHLYLVGNYEGNEIYYNHLKEQIDKLECKTHIHFTGKVSDEELNNYYRKSDVFVCMSEHEGFCLPILEGMYYNIPVIAYDACAVPETMGGAGILTYTKDPEILAKLIYVILSDDALRGSLLQKQRNRVEIFMEDGIREKLEKLIEKWSV